jgi:hypothetical protein
MVDFMAVKMSSSLILIVSPDIGVNIMDIPELPSLLEVIGKDVEHKLGVRVGVDMPVGLGVKSLPQSGGVDQVSVLPVSMRHLRAAYMGKADSVW